MRTNVVLFHVGGQWTSLTLICHSAARWISDLVSPEDGKYDLCSSSLWRGTAFHKQSENVFRGTKAVERLNMYAVPFYTERPSLSGVWYGVDFATCQCSG